MRPWTLNEISDRRGLTLLTLLCLAVVVCVACLPAQGPPSDSPAFVQAYNDRSKAVENPRISSRGTDRSFLLNAADFEGPDINAKVNAVIRQFPAEGGTVFIPAGIYNDVRTTLNISGRGIRLMGAGHHATRIIAAPGITNALLTVGPNINRLHIEGISFDCSHLGIDGWQFTDVSDSSFSDFEIQGCANGIHVFPGSGSGSWTMRFYGGMILNNIRGVFDPGGTAANNWSFYGTNISSNSTQGIEYNSFGLGLYGAVVEGNDVGLWMGSTDTGTTIGHGALEISGGYYEGNVTSQIRLGDTSSPNQVVYGTSIHGAYINGGVAAGTVDTAGTKATWISGTQFPTGHAPGWAGKTIMINSIPLVVRSVESATNLTLASSAGVEENAGYTVDSTYGVEARNVSGFTITGNEFRNHNVHFLAYPTGPRQGAQNGLFGYNTLYQRGVVLNNGSGITIVDDSGRYTLSAGVGNNGSGFKHVRVPLPSIDPGSSATVAVTWSAPFADAEYTPGCIAIEKTTRNTLQVAKIEAQINSSIVVRILNNDRSSSHDGSLSCWAFHD